MNSFEFNKIVASILIALLAAKGADLISRILICPCSVEEPVYKIKGAASVAPLGSQAEQKGPAPIEPLLAAANLKRGAEVFKKCTSCHTVDKGGQNRIGPNLYGIVGASKGKHPSYSYSPAIEQKGGTWTYDDLNSFLYNPRSLIPGTKMTFIGIKDDTDRAAVIAYLRSQSDSPFPLSSIQEDTPQELSQEQPREIP